jgi:pyruvate,water dikinase
MPAPSFIRWFSEIGLADVPEVGSKTASLGELSSVGPQGIQMPDGFAMTAAAYRDALDASDSLGESRRLMQFDHHDVA